MTTLLDECPFDIDDKLDEFFNENNNVKTEKSIITYDENDNKLQSELSEYTLKMTRSSIDDDKEMNKFIKKCESLIRSCIEYSEWTDYIRNVMEMTECQITGESHINAKSDVHHHPITLYIIVKAVILKYIATEREFSSIDVIKEVLEMHFQMKVPFTVLIKSIHELYHNSAIKIPMELVHGDYKYFLEKYSHYLSMEDAEPILEKLKVNWSNCGYDKKQYSWKKEKLDEAEL